MTPQEIIYKNKQLIELVTKHQYVPQESNAHLHEVVGALKQINPKAKYRTDCSGCVMEIIRTASVYLRQYEEELRVSNQFKTFPLKQPPPSVQEEIKKRRSRKG